jgi:annexin A7/11
MNTPQQDGDALRQAIKGKKDEDTIIKICANRTNAHRLQIAAYYKSAYGKDIISDLKSALSGNFEDAMVALFTPPVDYDCQTLRNAMKGLGTDEDTLIEVIATRPNWMIKQINQRYQEMYKKELIKEVRSETSGAFKNLLTSLLMGNRSENRNPNEAQCEQDAKELYEAGEKKFGTDSSVFNRIFALRSPVELGVIARNYHKITGHTILKAIDNEFSGDTRKLLNTIVYASLSPSEYFATKVNKAVKGWGTNDKLLIRVLVTRDEIDMPQIKQYYKQLYGKDMLDDIKNDTSGDYKKLLVELAGH